ISRTYSFAIRCRLTPVVPVPEAVENGRVDRDRIDALQRVVVGSHRWELEDGKTEGVFNELGFDITQQFFLLGLICRNLQFVVPAIDIVVAVPTEVVLTTGAVVRIRFGHGSRGGLPTEQRGVVRGA